MSGRLLRALVLWFLLLLGTVAVVVGGLVLVAALPFFASGWLLIVAGILWLIGTFGVAIAVYGGETMASPREEDQS